MLPLLVVCFYEKWEKMGWKSIGNIAGIEEAIDDIRHGRVTGYDSADDMFEKLGILNKEISDYFVKRADAELDRMWNDGTLNEERIESFRHLHERTPYDKPTL